MNPDKARINLRLKEIDNGRQSIYLDYYKDGKRIRESLHLYLLPEDNTKAIASNKKTIKQAQDIQQQRLKELTIFEKNIEVENAVPSILLADLINELEQIYHDKGDTSTANNVRCLVRAVKCYRGLETTLPEVDKDYCDKFVDYLRNDHIGWNGKITMTTARVYIYLFSSALNLAVDKEYIIVNPMKFVKVYDRITRELPKKIFLSVNEVKTLMNTQCPVLGRPQVKQAYLFALLTGMMPNDILNLKWKDIKTENDRTTVQYEPRKGTVIIVPLSPIALKWLPITNNHRGLVFKGLPCSSEIKCILKKWELKSGISKNLTFTVARNTFAYLLIIAGADIEVMCNFMGMSKKHFMSYLKMTEHQPATNNPSNRI